MIIWRWVLDSDDSLIIEAPENARFLSAQIRDGEITVWAMVEPKAKKKLYQFYIFGTGLEIAHPQPGRLIFLGTVQDGSYVWHVFVDTTL